jgi:hypothetical protein
VDIIEAINLVILNKHNEMYAKLLGKIALTGKAVMTLYKVVVNLVEILLGVDADALIGWQRVIPNDKFRAYNADANKVSKSVYVAVFSRLLSCIFR